jgi:nucleoside-diphosphate-sugar epimerase
VRIFNTYGPRSDPQDGRLIPNFCVQALQDLPLTVYGDGSQTRSFCYVDDLVAGLRSAMDAPSLAGDVINLGNEDEHSVLDIAREVIRAAGSASGIAHTGLPIDDPRRRRPDSTKAREKLGWAPTTPLDVGLRMTLDYFRRELNTPASVDSGHR